MNHIRSHVTVAILNLPAFPGIVMAKSTLVKYITPILAI